jgi:hypothetical protein
MLLPVAEIPAPPTTRFGLHHCVKDYFEAFVRDYKVAVTPRFSRHVKGLD